MWNSIKRPMNCMFQFAYIVTNVGIIVFILWYITLAFIEAFNHFTPTSASVLWLTAVIFGCLCISYFRMIILRTGIVALLLVVSAANASQPLESGKDQYKAHEDVPHPPQLLSEATDRTGDVHQSLGGNHFIKTKQTEKSEEPHQSQLPSTAMKQVESKEKLSKDRTDITKETEPRGKREIFDGSKLINQVYYNSWTPHAIIQVPPLESFSAWQPQVYQISRPYIIPVWGSPGRIPIYFPPQPLLVNPGYPAVNPPRRYLPPSPPDRTYLPSAPNATTSSPTDDSTTVETDSKFGDNGPVWDAVPVNPTTTVRPTRRTRRPGQTTTAFPPLVHNTESSASGGNQLSNVPSNSVVQPPSQQQRPPATNSRPPAAIPRPPVPQGGRQPSRCVWAIISCCSAASNDVSYSCFEQLGCTGAFWDASPCESEFARAAIENVMNYYNTE